jgi:hypothetical protein
MDAVKKVVLLLPSRLQETVATVQAPLSAAGIPDGTGFLILLFITCVVALWLSRAFSSRGGEAAHWNTAQGVAVPRCPLPRASSQVGPLQEGVAALMQLCY